MPGKDESALRAVAASTAVEVSAHYRGDMLQARCLHRPADRFVIGSGPGVDAPAATKSLAGAPDRHVLVERSAGVFIVHLPEGMTGEVERNGKALSVGRFVEDHGHDFVCRVGDRLNLRLGEVTFTIADGGAAPRPRRRDLTPRWFAGWRWREQKYTAATGAALALLMVAAFALPTDARQRVLAKFGEGVRFLALKVELMSAAGPDQPPPHPERRP